MSTSRAVNVWDRPPQITAISSLRMMSTAELLRISMGYKREQWSFDALGAIREIIQERSKNLPDFIEAVAEVRAEVDAEEARRNGKLEAAAARRERGLKLAAWPKHKMVAVRSLARVPSIRLALTIAAGVFLGLLAMRIATVLFRFFAN